MNSFKTLFDASLSQNMVKKVFYLFFSLPMTIAMRSPLLMKQFGIERRSMSMGGFLGWIDSLSQEMPTSVVNDALIQVQKAF